MTRAVLWGLLSAVLVGCATSPPRNVDNLCEIFREKDDWYEDAADARDEWGSSIPIMMAIVHQESRFQAKAKPPRTQILGFIPGPRKSSSYGYSQAKKSTWKEYKRNAGRYGADRDDFSDAIDFVGWYNYQSYRRSGISRSDPYRLYLAYHEGHGGYNRATYRNKEWLLGVARKVESRANRYQAQLNACEEDLQDTGWWPFSWF
ncbi:MAG: transglycosylase SLT domain-containing protein [Pseudomonadota bacterium]